MKVAAITDLHGRTVFGANAAAIAAADAVVVTGDITNFGGASDAVRVIDELERLNKNVLAVPGNCDRPDVNALLETRMVSIDRKCRLVDAVAFYGIGGSIRTPSGTLQEFSEEEFAAALGAFDKNPAGRYHVLACHQPPFDTNADRIAAGTHVGSRAIRSFIENFQPDLCVCGHIHEARSSDRIGRTLVINPGPFPAHYAEIELDDKDIRYRLH